MKEINGNIRATRRTALGIAAIPVFLGLAALQGLVARPIFKNNTAIPNLLYRMTRRLMGIKVVFNEASAPLVKDKPTWFVTNHTYGADYIPLGGLLNGPFIGKSDMMKIPVVGQVALALNFIGIHRSKEFNALSRAKIIKNFNAGHNAIMFPEGTVGDGKKIFMFHAGLITLLFGEKGVDKKDKEVFLEKEVVVQPVAMRLMKVDGKDATASDELKNAYRMNNQKNPLKVLWNKLKFKNVVFEMTAFEPLNPANFKDAKDLINQAAVDVASVVNPGQTTFEKAKIPGQKANIANKQVLSQQGAKLRQI